MKINSDLERIGDQAVNISQNTAFLLKQPPLKRRLLDIPRMACFRPGFVEITEGSLLLLVIGHRVVGSGKRQGLAHEIPRDVAKIQRGLTVPRDRLERVARCSTQARRA